LSVFCCRKERGARREHKHTAPLRKEEHTRSINKEAKYTQRRAASSTW
jgi:hypothetical protein